MTSILERSSAPRILAPLARWFDRNKRILPWRAINLKRKHGDPYAVLVSEFMLQQTQVNTVIPYFERWMKRFPNLKKLANASPETVMKYWEGLGYYRRCRNLHKTSQWIQQHGWPKDRSRMQSLAGIGSYTSAAIGSIAFQWSSPALDGNVIRFLSRLHATNLTNAKQKLAMEAWLQPALQSLGPSRLTQALMEFGSLVCKKSKPHCGSCPLKMHCQAFRLGQIDLFPQPKKKSVPKVAHRGLLIVFSGDRLLLQKPRAVGLLGGVYCFPTASLSPKDRTGVSYVHRYSPLIEHVYPIVIRVNNTAPSSPYRWVNRKKLSQLPFGNRDKLMLKRMHRLKPKEELSRSLQSQISKDIFKHPMVIIPIQKE